MNNENKRDFVNNARRAQTPATLEITSAANIAYLADIRPASVILLLGFAQN